MTVVLMLAGLALAQDEEVFEETLKEHEEAAKPVAEASAEVGGSVASGNSDFFQVTAKLAGGYKWGENRVSALGDALWGKGYVDGDGSGTLESAERRGDRVEMARRFSADARYDRFFGDKNSVYLLAGALVDPFAGYDLRTHEQLGYSRTVVGNDQTTLLLEVGGDYAQENYVDGVDPNYRDIIAAREMAALKHAFTEGFAIEEIVESYQNVLDVEDVRLNNTFTLSTKLSDKLSLKASHALRFDNQPVEGFRPVDQTALLTIVATLLKPKAEEPPPEVPCPCEEAATTADTPDEPAAEEGTTVTAPRKAETTADTPDEPAAEEGTTVTAPRKAPAEDEAPAPE